MLLLIIPNSKTLVSFYNKERKWLDVGKVKFFLSRMCHDLVFIFHPSELLFHSHHRFRLFTILCVTAICHLRNSQIITEIFYWPYQCHEKKKYILYLNNFCYHFSSWQDRVAAESCICFVFLDIACWRSTQGLQFELYSQFSMQLLILTQEQRAYCPVPAVVCKGSRVRIGFQVQYSSLLHTWLLLLAILIPIYFFKSRFQNNCSLKENLFSVACFHWWSEFKVACISCFMYHIMYMPLVDSYSEH